MKINTSWNSASSILGWSLYLCGLVYVFILLYFFTIFDSCCCCWYCCCYCCFLSVSVKQMKNISMVTLRKNQKHPKFLTLLKIFTSFCSSFPLLWCILNYSIGYLKMHSPSKQRLRAAKTKWRRETKQKHWRQSVTTERHFSGCHSLWNVHTSPWNERHTIHSDRQHWRLI